MLPKFELKLISTAVIIEALTSNIGPSQANTTIHNRRK
jgi:hypothetical protein